MSQVNRSALRATGAFRDYDGLTSTAARERVGDGNLTDAIAGQNRGDTPMSKIGYNGVADEMPGAAKVAITIEIKRIPGGVEVQSADLNESCLDFSVSDPNPSLSHDGRPL